jgi:hypothetical protein
MEKPSIDPKHLERARELSSKQTKMPAITKAVLELIARRRRKRLRHLMGKLEWDMAYDYKAERTRD